MSKIIGAILGLIIVIIFLVVMIKTGDPVLIKPAKTVLNSILIVGGLFVFIGIISLFK
jgi:hypothetical protein